MSEVVALYKAEGYPALERLPARLVGYFTGDIAMRDAEGDYFFSARDDDVIIMASKSLPQKLGDELTPWDLAALEPYNPDYIAGFRSEGYTIPLADGHQMGRAKIDATIRQEVMRDIGGDEQRIDSISTNYGRETFKHIMLPVWMAAYKYNGRSFRFLVNGQTAEVQGERPYSIWKIAFAVIGVAIVVAGAVYLNDPEALGLPRPDWLR